MDKDVYIPTIEEEKQNIKKNIWKENINPITGESSLQYHKLKVVGKWCAYNEHFFDYIKGGSRLIKCKKCNSIQTFILGKQTIQNGKLIILPVNS